MMNRPDSDIRAVELFSRLAENSGATLSNIKSCPKARNDFRRLYRSLSGIEMRGNEIRSSQSRALAARRAVIVLLRDQVGKSKELIALHYARICRLSCWCLFTNCQKI